MKWFLLLMLTCATAFGQLRNLSVDTNGNVKAPTNFFYTNFIAGANITLTPTFTNLTITASGGSGDASGTNARQFGTLALTNLSGNPYFGYTNIAAFQATNTTLTAWSQIATSAITAKLDSNAWWTAWGSLGSNSITAKLDSNIWWNAWGSLSSNSITAKLSSNVWQNSWGAIATNALTDKLASNANLGDWALYSTNAIRSTATNTIKWLTNIWGDVARGFGSLSDGQVLKYHSASSTWTNGTDNTSAGGSGWSGVNASATNVTIYGTNLTIRADNSSFTGVNIEGNTNSYFQLHLQNKNSGASASGDLVITANNGSETTRYVDLGVNGSGGGAAPFTTANHAYLYSIDDVLNIGALGTSPNADIRFHAGGGLSPVEIGRIDTNGLRLRVGQSVSNAWVGGVMFVDTSSYTNCCNTTALTNMGQVVIPGNTLTNNGDVIRWQIAGQMANALATTNNVAVVFGSQDVLNTGLQIASNRMWTATGTITRTGNTSQRVESTLHWPGAGTFAIATNFVSTIAQTNGINTTLFVQGASRRGAVLTNMLLRVIYEPAPR